MRRNRTWGIWGSWWLLLLAGCANLAPHETQVSRRPAMPKSGQAARLPEADAARVCLAMAASLEQAQDEMGAIKLYQQALLSNPKIIEASHKLGRLYDRLGEVDKARQELTRALEQAPKNVDLLNDLSLCLYRQGEYGEAEKHLRLAVSLDGQNEASWLTLGLTLGQLGKYEESIESLRKVVSVAEAHYRLAVLLSQQGKEDEARQAYEEALTHDPDLKEAREALAKLRHTPSAQTRQPASRETAQNTSASRPQLPPTPFVETDGEPPGLRTPQPRPATVQHTESDEPRPTHLPDPTELSPTTRLPLPPGVSGEEESER